MTRKAQLSELNADQDRPELHLSFLAQEDPYVKMLILPFTNYVCKVLFTHSKLGGDTMDVRVLNSTKFHFFVNKH